VLVWPKNHDKYKNAYQRSNVENEYDSIVFDILIQNEEVQK